MNAQIPEAYSDFVAVRSKALNILGEYGKKDVLAYLALEIKNGNITDWEADYICREANIEPPIEW